MRAFTKAMGSGPMFDHIAPRYDLLNRLMSLGRDRAWRRRLVDSLALSGQERVLDVATGTGDVAIDLVRRHPQISVVGVDPSPGMLEVGRRKIARWPQITLRPGDAQTLDLPDAAFDAATMAFGIRNVPDRARALGELLRVLRPGGRLALLELAEPPAEGLGHLARLHLHLTVPLFGALAGSGAEYRYLRESVARFPARERFVGELAGAGFEAVRAEVLTFGACVLFTARRPAE